MSDLEDRTFLWVIVGVSVAFAWILWPFFGTVLWATIAAIVFAPLYRRLLTSMRQRRTPAALAAVTVITVMVILPLTVLTALLVQEAAGVYDRIQSGDLKIGRYFRDVFSALPAWAIALLNRFGLMNLDDVQEMLTTGLLRSSQFLAGQALSFGQNAFDFIMSLFVMLYLLFFLLRDGDELARRIRDAVPLRPEQRHALLETFAVVIRATVKGNVVVAVLQGALGGFIFWFLGIHAPVLWGALMAIFSLLPAVGAALVWLPVAVYLLATGAVWQGVVLIAWGALVIGLVDNVVRPVLVGKETKMPDYVVLISTLGGIAVFGVNGFVVGPVIAAMFMAAWQIFATSRSGVP
jgi:predicted PurR-regulated permease PerM